MSNEEMQAKAGNAPGEESPAASQPPQVGGSGQPWRARTWGEVMAQQARSITRRRLPALPWLNAINLVFEHVTALPVPVAGHFHRVEAAPVDLNAQAQPSPEPGELEDTEGRLLPADLRSRLQELLGEALPTMRLHAGEEADRLARAHRADAVTVGQDIYFRPERFHPRQPEGFALLAHEATHVLQAMRPDAAWQRATQAGVNRQETEASAKERLALAGRPATLPELSHSGSRAERSVPRIPLQAAAPAGSASTAARPMTALSDRGSDAAAPAAAAPNFDELRSALYRDLMSQIKADFERGG